jgi:glycine/D-amino acid oxidase-like deaminating enzyme
VITVVGAGLAGSVLALELAALGQSVSLIDPGSGATPNATALSYGLLPPQAGSAWRRLQRRHGDLGLRRRWLQLGRRALPLPALQVDPRRFAAAAAAALQRLGVARETRALQQPEALAPLLAQGPVVLACGSGCRQLAPQLEGRLRCSWAGILELPPSCRPAWPRGVARLPARFERQQLEQEAEGLQDERWIVDAGLVPCGDRLLAGQITLVRPDLEPGPPPEPAVMEQRLRGALARRWPLLAAAPGHYQQAAVSFCSDGVPLVGPAGDGLWVLAGFSGAFGQLPAAAAALAVQLAAGSG